MRRLAGRARTSERNRREREKRTARPEAQPSAADMVVELENLRALHRSVERLHEPYRTAVCMRFFDDFSPRSIGVALNLPVETVRTHLKRALEKLRRDLDAMKARDQKRRLRRGDSRIP